MLFNDKYNRFTEQELIAEYKLTQNKVLVGILYKRFSHLVLGLCIKYLKDEEEAKDAIMHIFEKLMTDLLKYEVHYFKSWLYTFSKNHCLMIIRTRQNRLKKEADIQANASLFMETENISHHSSSNEKEKEYQNLEEAIGELNTEQKKCIEMFYMKEKSYQQIVDLTGYTLNEVKSYVQNGKRNLKIKIEKKGDPQR